MKGPGRTMGGPEPAVPARRAGAAAAAPRAVLDRRAGPGHRSVSVGVGAGRDATNLFHMYKVYKGSTYIRDVRVSSVGVGAGRTAFVGKGRLRTCPRIRHADPLQPLPPRAPRPRGRASRGSREPAPGSARCPLTFPSTAVMLPLQRGNMLPLDPIDPLLPLYRGVGAAT